PCQARGRRSHSRACLTFRGDRAPYLQQGGAAPARNDCACRGGGRVLHAYKRGEVKRLKLKISGLSGLTTREDSRRRGVASAVMRRATQEIQETLKVDFGLLFCEPRNASFYTGLGWQSFKGDVLVMQPRGQVRFDVLDPYVFALKIAPGTGVLDLCGSPW